MDHFRLHSNEKGSFTNASYFLAIILFTIYSFAPSNCRSEYRYQDSLELSQLTYETTGTIVKLFQDLDGRKSLLRKISFAKNIKSPYLTPINDFFEEVSNSPVGKVAGLVSKGITVKDAVEQAADAQTGENTGPTAFLDPLATIATLEPSGLIGLYKTFVYDKMIEINNKMDEIRNYQQAGDEAMISMASQLLDDSIYNKIASNLDTSNIKTEEQFSDIVESAKNKHKNLIDSARAIISQYIAAQYDALTIGCGADFCGDRNGEVLSRIRYLQTWFHKLYQYDVDAHTVD